MRHAYQMWDYGQSEKQGQQNMGPMQWGQLGLGQVSHDKHASERNVPIVKEVGDEDGNGRGSEGTAHYLYRDTGNTTSTSVPSVEMIQLPRELEVEDAGEEDSTLIRNLCIVLPQIPLCVRQVA